VSDVPLTVSAEDEKAIDADLMRIVTTLEVEPCARPDLAVIVLTTSAGVPYAFSDIIAALTRMLSFATTSRTSLTPPGE
jgi:hypothetical protein